MALADRIHEQVKSLPHELQSEVLDFVQFLIGKARRLQPRPVSDDWTARSIDAAMRGMEDEGPEYSEADLIRDEV
jgi:hypothetical protein